MNRLTHLQPTEVICGLPLTQLSFYVTDGCNLTCRYCWAGSRQPSEDSARRYLPVDRIGAAVREGLPLGLQSVRLSGGEPLLHPDIERLIDQLENLELAIEIETTGHGLTPLRAARLAHLRRCSVLIALDGINAVTHDAIHHAPGSFDIAVQAVKLLSTAGIAPQIVTSVMRSNINQVPALIRLAESLGAASLRLVMINTRLAGYQITGANIPYPGEKNPEGLAVEELIALGRRVERDMAPTTRLQLIFEQPPVFRGLHSMSNITGQGRCHILNSLSVLPTGEYGLCGSAERLPSLTFGQVGVVPLEQIWNEHPTLSALRQGMPDRLEGVCGHCIMKTSCLGNCAVENYLYSGAFWGPYWFCDAAAQSGLFPAGRIIENVW